MIHTHTTEVGAVMVRRSESGEISASYEHITAPVVGPDEIMVRPAFAGICGSDLEQLHGRVPDSFKINFPHTMGHEWSGSVVEVGSQVTNFSVGDQVLGHGHLGGNDWFGFTHNGAMSDVFAVPARMCFPVPDGVSMKSAAMVEPFACVMEGVSKLGGIRADDVVHVYGLGTIGLCAVMQAVAVGATVIGLDPSALRRQRAVELGAVGAIDPIASTSIETEARELVGRPLADVVVEASGAPSALPMALEGADSNARVLMLGVSKPVPVPTLLSLVQQQQLTVVGSNGAPAEIWEPSIRFIAEHHVDLEPLATSLLPFSQIDDAVRRAEDAQREIKVLLRPEA